MKRFFFLELFLVFVVLLSVTPSTGMGTATTLLPPRVIGPLSECSTHIEVQGQLTGSTVRVFASDRLVAEGIAGRSRFTFPLLPGEKLNPGDAVVAEQETSGSPSDRSPDPVIVQAGLNQVGPVAFRTETFQCGQCIWITGAVPGAIVEVGVFDGPNFNLRGIAGAPHGNARMRLDPPTGSSEVLTARQTACGVQGPDVESSPAQNLYEYLETLPPPIVESPLIECGNTVTVSGVFPGAMVTLNRIRDSEHITHSGCFDLSRLTFPINPILQLDEEVTAVAEFSACDLQSQSQPVTVECADPVPIPYVVPPICKGSTSVRVANIIPGSKVKILVDGNELGIGETPDSSVFAFPVPALTQGTVTAVQELCGNWSRPSNGVQIEPLPGNIPDPTLVGPLYACGGMVHVKDVYPGAQVTIWSQMLGAPIGLTEAISDEVSVHVYPLLIDGDEITARVTGCDGLEKASRPVEVEKIEGLQPPEISGPVVDGDTVVKVTQVVPGAMVDVYVNGLWYGGQFIPTTEGAIALNGPVKVDSQIRARQTLCGEKSEVGPGTSIDPPTERTYSKININNCLRDFHRADIWLFDYNTDTWDNVGQLDSQWHIDPPNEWCPEGLPLTVELVDRHRHLIVALDELKCPGEPYGPENPNCWREDRLNNIYGLATAGSRQLKLDN